MFTAVQPDAGSIAINWGQGGPVWDMLFAAPMGQALAVGTYENARRGAAPGTPGMDVRWAHVGCNVLFGRFTILELVLGAAHEVTSFAVDYEQHCEGVEPALYGSVRFNSAVPYVPPSPPPFGPASITLAMGNAPAQTFGRGDGMFKGIVNSRGGVDIELVRPPLPEASAPPHPTWHLNFSSAAGVPFGPGTYNAAEQYANPSPGHPGMDVSGNGYTGPVLGCSALSGRFVVREVEYGPIGTVTKFAADFEQTCAGSTELLSGGVRFNSTLPYSPLPPVPPPAPPPSTPQHASAPSPSGLGTIFASLFSTQSTCAFDQAQVGPVTSGTPGFGSLPPHFVFPFGLATFGVKNCGVGQAVDFTVDYPKPLPPNAVFWRYGPTPDNRDAHWYPMTGATIEGSRVSFHLVDGDSGDDDLASNGAITVTGGVMTAGGLYQDMWWAGAAENGWGMSIAQHADTLFSVIYAYDAAGKPTWYVMPGGTWDSEQGVYTGALYTPRGTPFFSYDASRLVAGAPVGTLSIRFTGSNSGSLDYTINGVTGHKSIERQAFGVRAGVHEGTLGDMWWGGSSQNGWGIAALQQFSTLFLVWFTYDANGAATWYVMPGGAWTSANVYEGHVFRTTGSPWSASPYDPAQLKVLDVGTYRVEFNGDAATFSFTVDGHSGTMPLARQPF